MSTPPEPPSLQDALKVAYDIRRGEYVAPSDWERRKADITGAWQDATEEPDASWLEKLRVAVLTPLSLAEHGANRALAGTATTALRPVLAHMLKQLEGTPEAEPYGTALAQAVANALETKAAANNSRDASLVNIHKYYCGMGFRCDLKSGSVRFDYGHTEDGYLSEEPVLSFDTTPDFSDWLAAQSDLSLSGLTPPLEDWDYMGNQRITRTRLQAYLSDAKR